MLLQFCSMIKHLMHCPMYFFLIASSIFKGCFFCFAIDFLFIWICLRPYLINFPGNPASYQSLFLSGFRSFTIDLYLNKLICIVHHFFVWKWNSFNCCLFRLSLFALLFALLSGCWGCFSSLFSHNHLSYRPCIRKGLCAL